MAVHTSHPHKQSAACVLLGADNLSISEAVDSPNQFSAEEETNRMDKTS